MLRCLGLIALSLASVAAHGAGVWTDPKHALGDGSLAGLRFVAESPPHVLTLVSTDNGVDWYTLHGSCSGVGMTTITIDFAPKGGPSEPLSGTWGSTEAGGATITWPDGNVWPMASAPTAAWQQPTPLDDHQVCTICIPIYHAHIIWHTVHIPCTHRASPTQLTTYCLLLTTYHLPLTRVLNPYHLHSPLTTRASSPTLACALTALPARASSQSFRRISSPWWAATTVWPGGARGATAPART